MFTDINADIIPTAGLCNLQSQISRGLRDIIQADAAADGGAGSTEVAAALASLASDLAARSDGNVNARIEALSDTLRGIAANLSASN